MNRAFDGDVVAVELLPESEWFVIEFVMDFETSEFRP
jgi:hypothetical protein